MVQKFARVIRGIVFSSFKRVKSRFSLIIKVKRFYSGLLVKTS
jgi:hypothetical protein